MSGRPTIRPAQPGDLDGLVELLQVLFAMESDFTPDADRQRQGLMRFMANRGRQRQILVAEAEGRVVAMATVQRLISTAQGGPVGWVEDVVVQEAYRGRGLGRNLMTALVEWAVSHGLTRLQLLADQENRTALSFYHRSGWHSTHLICLRQFPSEPVED